MSEVFSNAIAAAACCAFLIEGPEAMYSSLSPSFKQTVKDFLCAGPEVETTKILFRKICFITILELKNFYNLPASSVNLY